MAVVKRLRDKNAIELRITVRTSASEKGAEAYAELERRVGNLKGGLVPEWEKLLRGPIPALWKLA